MAAVMEVEVIPPLAAAAAEVPIVPLALSDLTLAQHARLVALPDLVPHTPAPAPKKHWNWSETFASPRIKTLARKATSARTTQEKKDLMEAAQCEFNARDVATRPSLVKLGKKYNIPRTSLRRILKNEQSITAIGSIGKHTVPANLVRALAQLADEKAKQKSGMTTGQVSSHSSRRRPPSTSPELRSTRTHPRHRSPPPPRVQYEKALGELADAATDRGLGPRRGTKMSSATRRGYSNRPELLDLNIKMKRETVKSTAKSAATAPKTVAALYLNLKGCFENHDWPGAALGIAAVPTSNIIFHDEVSMVGDGAKRGEAVVIVGANGNYACGHELTEGGFHVTLMAGVAADGTPQPGFLVYSGKDWCTALGRLRGIMPSWTATWTKTGSMLKNKHAASLAKIAVQILDPCALALEGPVEPAAAEVVEVPPPTVSHRVIGARTIARRGVAESAASAIAAAAAAAAKVAVSGLVVPSSELMKALGAARPTEADLQRRIANLAERAAQSNGDALQLVACSNFVQAKVHAREAMAQLTTQRELEQQLEALRSGLGVLEANAASKVRKAAQKEQEEQRGVMAIWARHVIRNRVLHQTKGDILHVMDQHASVRFCCRNAPAVRPHPHRPPPSSLLQHFCLEALALLKGDNHFIVFGAKEATHFTQVGDRAELNGRLQTIRRKIFQSFRSLFRKQKITQENIGALIQQAYYAAMGHDKIIAAVKGVGFRYSDDGKFLTIDDAAIDAAIEKHKALYRMSGNLNIGGAVSVEKQLRCRYEMQLRQLAKQPGFEWLQGHAFLNPGVMAAMHRIVDLSNASNDALSKVQVPKLSQIHLTEAEIAELGGRELSADTEARIFLKRKATAEANAPAAKKARKERKSAELVAGLAGAQLVRTGTKKNGGTVSLASLKPFFSGEASVEWAVDQVRARRAAAAAAAAAVSTSAAAQ